MNRLEIVAAALGFANIILLVRRSIWNFPVGLAMVGLYAWVFFAARLYSDALLQLLFFAVQIYGWSAWRAAKVGAGEIAIERLRPASFVAVLAAALLASLVWGALMARFTNAAFPFLDGANAMFSIAAQILLARRLIENWPIWIGVDLLAIGLYLSRGLVATAVLYAVMFLLCIAGWREWHQATRFRPQRCAA